MCTALELLDQAMTAAREERQLLEAGKPEEAQALARQREALVAESWRLREGCAEAELRGALERLRELHEGAVGEARRQREEVRRELQQMQGNRKRSVAYGTQRYPAAAFHEPRFLDRKG
ncbi:MAG: hypothetical protein PHX58_03285 [Desulfovibrio sp.]|jgi:hypothetical protein|nr:hypothetical protein [Desulfovibrio sp.]